ncbi:hypothetical protein AgCh_003155 [Apium graveolens]
MYEDIDTLLDEDPNKDFPTSKVLISKLGATLDSLNCYVALTSRVHHLSLNVLANIERVPLQAPRSPPETGTSIEKQPLAAAFSEISTAIEGSEVVMSTRIPPELRPERAPEVGWSMTWRMSEG